MPSSQLPKVFVWPPFEARTQEINNMQLLSLYKQGFISHVVYLFHVDVADEDTRPIPEAIGVMLEEFEDIVGEPTK